MADVKLDIKVNIDPAIKSLRDFANQAKAIFRGAAKSAAVFNDSVKGVTKSTKEVARETKKFSATTRQFTKAVGSNVVKSVKKLDQSLKPATANLRKFNSEISQNKRLRESEKSVNLLSQATKRLGVIAASVFAVSSVVRFGRAVISSASRQEDAINSLNTALRTSGEFSDRASRDLQDFASSLQQVTKFGDEAVLEQLALAKAFGATNDQAKLVTEAAVELAAATGKSLEEATRQVAKTLGGFAGELGEVNPAIKALTAEQLRAGEAARVLIEQYGGTATAQLDTFSGATAQLSNTFGDLLEEIGFLITRNPVVIRSIKAAEEGVREFIQSLETGSLGLFVADLSAAAETIATIASDIGSIIPDFETVAQRLAFLSGTLRQEFSSDEVERLTRRLNFITRAFEGSFKAAERARTGALNFVDILTGRANGAQVSIERIRREVEELRPEFQALGKDIEEAGGKFFVVDFQANLAGAFEGLDNFIGPIKPKIEPVIEDPEIKRLEDALRDIVEGPIQSGIGADELARQIVSSAPDEIELDVKSTFDRPPDADEEVGPQISPIRRVIRDLVGRLSESFGKDFSGLDNSLQNFVTGFGGQIDQLTSLEGGASSIIAAFAKGGREGAEELVTGAARGLADAILPGLGTALAPAFELFTQGPEATREAVESLVEALPDVITAFAESAPAFVTAIAENVDEIIIALAKGTPEIVRALVIEIPKALTNPALWEDVAIALGQALGDELEEVGLQFGAGLVVASQGITDGLRNVVTATSEFFRVGLSDALKQIPREISNGFDAAAKAFADALSEPFQRIWDSLVNNLGTSLTDIFKGIPGLITDGIKDGIKEGVAAATGTGGGGVIGTIGRGIESFREGVGLQGGGIIPPGFPNDSFAANLTSGEEVVSSPDRSEILGKQDAIINQLARLNDNMGGGQMARVTLDIDGSTLADSILELNRNNQRLEP